MALRLDAETRNAGLAVRRTGARLRPVPAPLRLAALASCALAAAPGSAEGQLAQLLQAIKEGGGWARFSVEDGRGAYRSAAVPVAGLSLDGCFQVVRPATGTWTLTARDMLGDGRIEATVGAGEPVRFRYEAGFRTRLDVVVEWSEPRDTTLVVWIGLETLAQEGRDVCQPPPDGQPLQAEADAHGRAAVAGQSTAALPVRRRLGARPKRAARRSLHVKQDDRPNATAAAATTSASTTAASQASPVIRST